MSTTARERLAAGQQRAADLAATVTALWADAAAGIDVDPATLVHTEAEQAIATRMLLTFQTMAAAEVEAEQRATWEQIETHALAEHEQLAAAFYDKIESARVAMLAAVDSAAELDQHHQAFRLDRRRPPTLVDGYPQSYVDPSRLTNGQTLRTPGAGDVVMAVAADGLDQCAAAGTPAWGEYHRQCQLVRDHLTLPTDPRSKDATR